jgi:hypothetical protein
MNTVSRTVLVKCDMCGDEMQLQHDESYVCWRDQHRIPAEQLYRYAEHITVTNDDVMKCDECGVWQESGFVSDDGWCMDCEEIADAN